MTDGISIVICSYNGSQRIAQTLGCLAQQTVSGSFPWEVLLIDNLSTDHTAEAARQAWTSSVPLRVMVEGDPGVRNARLRGIREAAYEFIAFVDDDNHVDEHWLQTAYDLMQSLPQAGAIGGLNLPEFESVPPNWYETYQACYAVGAQAEEEGEISRPTQVLWSAGMVLRRTAWQDLERMNFQSLLVSRVGNKLLSGEDSEICYMLRLAGWKLYYTPRLKLGHLMTPNRLNWRYLCRLKRGFGATSVILSMYRRLYEYSLTGIRPQSKFWWQEVLADLVNVLSQPRVLAATLLGLFEGNARVLNMHALLGRLGERLRLLGREDAIEHGLWERYMPNIKVNRQ